MTLSREQFERLGLFIQQWEETPYLAGQCCPGPSGGVDCLRYVDQGLQQTRGVVLDPLPREAQDAAFHDRDVVVRMGLLMVRRHNLVSIRTRPPFKPADTLCVRTKTPNAVKREDLANLSPHHLMIVGPDGIRVWHAGPSRKVSWMGLGGVPVCYDIIQAWRMQ